VKQLPTPEISRAARERIAPHVRRTRVVAKDGVTYKFEFEQVTGSFKPRGAFNTALQLSAEERERGIVAFSGGNHGLASAHVGKVLGIRATVFMPNTTPAYVVERARADGAELVLTSTIAEAFEGCSARAAAGQTLMHPYDDERVWAGQSTVGLELFEDIPDLATLIVSIGGGGLMTGISSVIKALRPDVRIFGVETIGAEAMRLALDTGHPVTIPITSIARTLGAPSVSESTLGAVRRNVENVVVVSDEEAVRSILQLQELLGVNVEPAAACCHAALRLGLIPTSTAGTTAILLCGGNVTPEEIEAWRGRFGLGAKP
jgi:threonine dehydratase